MRRVLLLVPLLLLAACAGPAPRRDGPMAMTINPVWKSCPANEAGDGSRLDDSFRPTSVIICRSTVSLLPRAGASPSEQRAENIQELVAALELPDLKPADGPCTAEAIILPWMALVDAQGRWVHPHVPVDSCGKARIEVRRALSGLHLPPLPTKPVKQGPAGCAPTWADMVWVAGTMGAGRATPPDLASDGTGVTVCVYRVPETERGAGKPTGFIETGHAMKAATWAKVRRLLAAAVPASACTTPATRFAVLRTAAGEVYAEADGCRRILVGSTLRQGSDDLTGLILAH